MDFRNRLQLLDLNFSWRILDLNFSWFWRVVVAGVKGELEDTIYLIVVNVDVVHVCKAHAELVIVPREVANMNFSLMLVCYVVAVKTTVRRDSIGAVMKVMVGVQRICS